MLIPSRTRCVSKISVSVPQEKPLLTTPAIQCKALRVLLTISTADRAQKDSVIKALICQTHTKLTLASCIWVGVLQFHWRFSHGPSDQRGGCQQAQHQAVILHCTFDFTSWTELNINPTVLSLLLTITKNTLWQLDSQRSLTTLMKLKLCTATESSHINIQSSICWAAVSRLK